MAEQESHSNGVRVTNADIYKLLLDTNARVASVEQTVRDVVQPNLNRAAAEVERLRVAKADADALKNAQTRLEKVEMRMYAIVSGLIAAFIGGKGIGIL